MCEHYKRKCKLISNCCNKEYDCRLCHDKIEYEENITESAHKLDRKSTKLIVCLDCKKIQNISNNCINCKIKFSEYFCKECILYDGLSKNIFHCDKCKICRVGGRENFIHCDTCNVCMNKNYEHECASIGNCGICLEDMEQSINNWISIKCKHKFHYNCLIDYLKTNYKCPLCQKTIPDGMTRDALFNSVKNEVNANPMPEEYKNTKVNIICNDCTKISNVNFHFIAMECSQCNSFNTKTI